MQKVLIIGGGPAGLTAAYELLKHGDFKPIVIEEAPQPGGISKTIVYKGNRMDIGGHRFFSKSDKIMQWYQIILLLTSFLFAMISNMKLNPRIDYGKKNDLSAC